MRLRDYADFKSCRVRNSSSVQRKLTKNSLLTAMMEDLRQPSAVKNDKNSVVKLQQKPRASFFVVNVEKRIGQRSGHRRVRDCG